MDKPLVDTDAETAAQSAIAFCNRTIAGIEKKADHNKTEAMRCLVISMLSTLLAPIFIMTGEGLVVGKLIPALLTAVATFCTAWMQLRKPQQLWALYRGAQRELEDERTKFRFLLEPFASASDPEKLLAERVANIALTLHDRWAPLVPNPESLRLPSDASRQ